MGISGHRSIAGRFAVAGVLLAVAAPCAQSAEGYVQASALPGNTILVGPALSGGHAFWPESAPGLLMLRSLDGQRGTKTVWASADAPGLSSGESAVLSVQSIAAGSGTVALIRTVAPEVAGYGCPPGGVVCYAPPSLPRVRPVSATLLAGRPGAIQPLRTVTGSCPGGLSPADVAVSAAGLVTYEVPSDCHLTAAGPRIVLRSTRGRMMRSLHVMPPLSTAHSLTAAGRWAGWLEDMGTAHVLRIIDLRDGRTVLTRPEPEEASTLALDAWGNFAIAMSGTQADACQPGNGAPSAEIEMASVANPRQRTIVSDAAGTGIAIFKGRVAYRATEVGCPAATGAAIFRDKGNPLSFSALSGLGGIAYNGKTLAVAGEDTVRLVSLKPSHPRDVRGSPKTDR